MILKKFKKNLFLNSFNDSEEEINLSTGMT